MRKGFLMEVSQDGTTVRARWNNRRFELDESTGLPVTPEGTFWRVSRFNYGGYEYRVSLRASGFFGRELEYSLATDSDDILAAAVFALDKYRPKVGKAKPTREQKRASRVQARENARRVAEATKDRRKKQAQFVGNYPPKKLPKGNA